MVFERTDESLLPLTIGVERRSHVPFQMTLADEFRQNGLVRPRWLPAHRRVHARERSPRFHYDPNEVIDDYCHAISYMLTREDVDADRIGIVGVCMGGGYAVSTGARDKRIKAAVSVAGGYNIGGTFQQFFGVDGFAGYYRQVNDLVMKQYRTGDVQCIPTIAQALSPDVPLAAMPNPEAYSYYDRTSKDDAPNWSRTITAASLEPVFHLQRRRARAAGRADAAADRSRHEGPRVAAGVRTASL